MSARARPDQRNALGPKNEVQIADGHVLLQNGAGVVPEKFCYPKCLANVLATDAMSVVTASARMPGTADDANPDSAMLVGLEDITESRDVRRRQEAREKLQATLLAEVHHRVANSLQMIAGILSIKAVKAESRETRIALQDALHRLTLVASVERQLCAPGAADDIAFAPYLAKLCTDLAGSMLAEDMFVAITSSCSRGNVKSNDAASMGMIVTELVTNALKHGFPDNRRGRIAVDFALNEQGWRLSVTDDGVGHSSETTPAPHGGVGSKIVHALAQHLSARVEMSKGTPGTAVAIIYGGQEQISSGMVSPRME